MRVRNEKRLRVIRRAERSRAHAPVDGCQAALDRVDEDDGAAVAAGRDEDDDDDDDVDCTSTTPATATTATETENTKIGVRRYHIFLQGSCWCTHRPPLPAPRSNHR